MKSFLSVGLAAALLQAGPAAQGDSWAGHEASLQAHVTKIKSLEGERDRLLKEKASTRDNARLEQVLKGITKVYRDIERAYDEFNREREHIRFEHPEQGDTMERQYRRVRLKTVEEREAELGLNGRLNVLKYKIEKTYGKPANKPRPSSPGTGEETE